MVKKIHRILIFGNGTLHNSYVSDIRSGDVVIGVDRAAWWLLARGVVPHAAIGDFDSVTREEIVLIRKKVAHVITYPARKDATDLDLAVGYAVDRKMSHIIIYGGIGTRLDHQTAATQLLEKFHKKGRVIILKDDRNEAFMVIGTQKVRKSTRYAYLSVIPISRKALVSLKGVRYPVAKRIFRRGETLGVSNEIIGGYADITVHSGKVLAILSRD